MNVCKVPDMYKDMEYKYITEDSKTRVYLSVVREFNEAEYEKYYIRKKKEKVRKRILFIARALKYALPVLASTILYNMLSNKLYLERGSYEIGSEIVFVGIFGIALFGFLNWFIGGFRKLAGSYHGIQKLQSAGSYSNGRAAQSILQIPCRRGSSRSG